MSKTTILLSITVLFFSVLSKGKTLKIAGAYLPANMEKSGTGREADIVREILDCAGYKVNFDVQPYARHFVSYSKTNTYDGIVSVPETKDLNGYKSNSHILYQNGISTIASNHKKSISELKDLAQKKVVSFVGAKTLLPKLRTFIPYMSSYQELSRQDLHSQLLFDKKIDAVISDGLIFAAHNSILKTQNADNEKYRQQTLFFASFPPTPFVVYFKEKKVKNQFNNCLKKIKENGEHKSIQKKYINLYKDTLRKQYPIE